MNGKYEDSFPVNYGQLYLLPDDSYGVDLYDAFRGQRNGLCGTAVQEAAFLITGLHTGNIHLIVDIFNESPKDQNIWHEVVEAPLTVRENGLWLVSWCGEVEIDLELRPDNYRIRYSAQNMGVAEEQNVENAEHIEKYHVAIWPSDPKQDEIIKQTSDVAKYWHNTANSLDILDKVELERSSEKIRPKKRATPEFVYVPTEDAYSTVVITLQKQAKIGEWIELSAERQNSPWKKVEFTKIVSALNYSVSEPPVIEEEVAAYLSWNVEPSGECIFDVPTAEEAQSNIWRRRVRFSKPGRYYIQGFSAYPVPTESNVKEIIVV